MKDRDQSSEGSSRVIISKMSCIIKDWLERDIVSLLRVYLQVAETHTKQLNIRGNSSEVNKDIPEKSKYKK